jgi:hypothetical protein
MLKKNWETTIGDLEKVETIEEFRNSLLKLFYSNQITREIYVKLGKNICGDICKYISVDELNSFEDILKLSVNRDVCIIPKIFSEYFFDKKCKEENINLHLLKRLFLIDNEFSYNNHIMFYDNVNWIEICNNNIKCLMDILYNDKFHPISI